jgi:hypothetical protein
MRDMQMFNSTKIQWVCGAISAIKDNGEIKLMILPEADVMQKIDELVFDLYISAIMQKKGCLN